MRRRGVDSEVTVVSNGHVIRGPITRVYETGTSATGLGLVVSVEKFQQTSGWKLSRSVGPYDIISCTCDDGGVVVRTGAEHGLSTGESVILTGTTLYDGTYAITVIDSTHYSLDDSICTRSTVGGSWENADTDTTELLWGTDGVTWGTEDPTWSGLDGGDVLWDIVGVTWGTEDPTWPGTSSSGNEATWNSDGVTWNSETRTWG